MDYLIHIVVSVALPAAIAFTFRSRRLVWFVCVGSIVTGTLLITMFGRDMSAREATTEIPSSFSREEMIAWRAGSFATLNNVRAFDLYYIGVMIALSSMALVPAPKKEGSQKGGSRCDPA